MIPNTTYSQCFCHPIPDTNFEQRLVDLGYDSNGLNGNILTSDALAVTILDLSSQNISDLTPIDVFINLEELYVSNNSLSELNLHYNQKLRVLHCKDNNLQSLSVFSNHLTFLWCAGNQLSSLYLGNVPNLTALLCNDNNLTSIDVSNNTNLGTFYCASNQLTSLDVSTNTALVSLGCFDNQITSLDVSANTALNSLSCADNQITSLDVSTNSLLDQLRCQNNQLTSLNVKNGNNSNMPNANFDATNNSLTCITVDDPIYSNANWTNIDPNVSFVPLDCSLYTAIPDQNFEQKLIDLGLDSGPIDRLVLTSNINTLSTLNVSSLNISDLTGIEAFTSLTSLNCNNNQLTSLDVSSNTNLVTLDCASNQLTSLDVSNNTNLGTFYCASNQLTSLDVSNNTNLGTFYCNNNQISSLDVSQNTGLTQLICSGMNLTTLDVSANTSLTLLWCGSNDLTSLDVSTNTGLTDLRCNGNLITLLNVTTNTALTKLSCQNNQLTSLNVKNGNNLNMPNANFNATNNSLVCITVDDPVYSTNNWTNIDPGDFFAPIDCRVTLIPDANFETKLIALGVDSDNTVNGRIFTTDAEGVTGTLNIASSNISDLTGIEDFTNLTGLWCNSNQLNSLDVSQHTGLTQLICSSNNLTTLDVSVNTSLTLLWCGGNDLTSLDISVNTALADLRCDGNLITSLDVTTNTALTKLSCQNNQLTSLNVKNGNNSNMPNANFNATNNSLTCITVDDPIYSNANWTNIDPNVSFVALDCSLYTAIPDQNFEQKLISLGIDSGPIDGLVLTSNINTLSYLNVSTSNISDLTGIEAFTSLTTLDCNNNQLTSLDVSNNSSLASFYCSDNQLASLDVSNNTSLINFECSDNQLTSLDVSNNTSLINFKCSDNQLTSLDVSNNTSLNVFECNNNQLTSLDVNNNTSLINFYCGYNQLTSLDVSNNTGVELINCRNNQLTSLDVSNNTSVESINCSDNQLTSLDVSNNTSLIYFLCQYNQLTSLDVSNNTSLNVFECNNNQLTSLDVSNNPSLNIFYCSNNQLTSLDVSSNTSLTTLDCNNNQLTSLDVSNNLSLTSLQCRNNQLISLDVSSNTNLTHFTCDNNQLINLDVRNGNNTVLTSFWAFNNLLTCIAVDDPVYSTNNWTNIDLGVVFDIACPPINDVCADAIIMLDGNPPVTSVTHQSTNTEALTPCSGGGGGGDCLIGGTGLVDFTKGVWFKYTSITAGESVTIATDNAGTDFDTEIQVFEGSCGALTCVGGDDDGGDGTAHQYDSKFCFVTTASATDYYIYIDGHGNATGTAVVSLDVVPLALPVELVLFQGEAMDRTNILKWETASEENTQYHIIQRSADGNANWEEIGQLDAARNSTTTNQYSLEDTQPLDFGYYRLISLDFDGYKDYSDIISIKREVKADQVHLFPNPVSKNLTVEIGVGVASNYDITIVNMMGQVVSYDNHDFREGVQRIEIEVDHLADGVYYLVVESKTEKQIKKFVKQ